MSRQVQDFLERISSHQERDGITSTEKNMVNMLKRWQRSIQEGVCVVSRQIRERDNTQPVMKAEITKFITSTTTTVLSNQTSVNNPKQLSLPSVRLLYPILVFHMLPIKLIILVFLMTRLFPIKVQTFMLFLYFWQWCSHSHSKNEVLSSASPFPLIILTLSRRKKTQQVWVWYSCQCSSQVLHLWSHTQRYELYGTISSVRIWWYSRIVMLFQWSSHFEGSQ